MVTAEINRHWRSEHWLVCVAWHGLDYAGVAECTEESGTVVLDLVALSSSPPLSLPLIGTVIVTINLSCSAFGEGCGAT